MNTRELKRANTAISEVGIGTWQLGSAAWGVVDEKEALDILKRSVELGVDFFDTADVYGMGVSESIIGKFLSECPEQIHVATKLGRRGDDGNGWPQNFSLESMRRHTESSLKNLDVESIFLQQLHCIPTEELRKGEIFENLRILKKEGLIQNWGVSVESVEEGLLCIEQEDCTSLQVIFNIFRQKVNRELLQQCQGKGVGVLARVPLASGLLSGKFTSTHRFSEKDHRNYNADGQAFNVGETFAGLPFDQGVELSMKVKEILSLSGETSMAQLALRWILDFDAVTTVIPGASKITQAESNAAAADLMPLFEDIHQKLSKLYDDEIATHIRGTY